MTLPWPLLWAAQGGQKRCSRVCGAGAQKPKCAGAWVFCCGFWEAPEGVPRPHPGEMLPTQPGRLPGEPLRPLGSAPDTSPLGALPRAPRTLRAVWARPDNSLLALPGLQRPKRRLAEPPTYTTTPGARRLRLAGSSPQRCGWPCSWFLRVLEPSRSCCVTRAGAETSTRPLLSAQRPRPGSSRAPTDGAAGTLHPLLGPPRARVARQSGPSQPVREARWGREGAGVGASSPGRVGEHGEPGELRWPHGTARPGSAPAAPQHGATPPRLAPGAPCGEPGGGPPGDPAPSGPAAPPANRARGPSTPDGPGGSYLRAAPAGPRSPFSRLRLGAGEQRHIQGGPGLGTGRGGPYPPPSPALPRPRSRSSPGGRSELPEPRGGAARPGKSRGAPRSRSANSGGGGGAEPARDGDPGREQRRSQPLRKPGLDRAHARTRGTRARRGACTRAGPRRAPQEHGPAGRPCALPVKPVPCVHTSPCAHEFVHTRICAQTSPCSHKSMHTHVCAHTSLYAHKFAHTRVCAHQSVHTHTRTNANTQLQACTCGGVHVRQCTRVRAHTSSCTHTRTNANAWSQVCMCG